MWLLDDPAIVCAWRLKSLSQFLTYRNLRIGCSKGDICLKKNKTYKGQHIIRVTTNCSRYTTYSSYLQLCDLWLLKQQPAWASWFCTLCSIITRKSDFSQSKSLVSVDAESSTDKRDLTLSFTMCNVLSPCNNAKDSNGWKQLLFTDLKLGNKTWKNQIFPASLQSKFLGRQITANQPTTCQNILILK